MYKGTFGTCSTPLAGLDQYTRATLNGVSWFKTIAKCWKSRSMTSIFNTHWENSKMHIWCKFSDYSSNPLQVITETNPISKYSKSKWPTWPWRSRSMTSIFNTNRENPRMHVWCKFGDELSCGQVEFPRILSQNGQNDLEGLGQWPPFFYQPRISQDACLVQIWWF